MPTQVLTGSFQELRKEIRVVREAVFIAEQGIPRALVMDAHDAECFHVVVVDQGQPVAAGRIAPDGKVGRVAVINERRRQGLGRLVMSHLETWAEAAGLNRVWFHAQETAVEFYRRLGYRVVGGPFVEAGIPHRQMVRELADETLPQG